MPKKLNKLSLVKEIISDLTSVTGGANTYDATCDTQGNLTYRRNTACLSLCRACGGGSREPSNQSARQARPCACNPC